MSLLSYLHEPSRILRKARWSAMQARGAETELTADTWNGRLTFNSADRLIGKYLYVRRAYEKHYVTQVIAYLDRAGLRSDRRDVVLDIGANIGMIAIALVKHGWFRRAIAFEPEPSNFALLVRNVRQNGYEQAIACRQVGLSSSQGTLELVLNEGNSGGHFVRDSCQTMTGGSAARTVQIPTATCDGILASDFRDLAGRVGLIWMDIEGHEGHFLFGAEKTLARGIPVVSEFYPAAIERSGISRQQYLDLVRERFTHVCTCVGDRFVEQPVAAVEALFDQFDRDGTNVIYLRR